MEALPVQIEMEQLEIEGACFVVKKARGNFPVIEKFPLQSRWIIKKNYWKTNGKPTW